MFYVHPIFMFFVFPFLFSGIFELKEEKNKYLFAYVYASLWVFINILWDMWPRRFLFSFLVDSAQKFYVASQNIFPFDIIPMLKVIGSVMYKLLYGFGHLYLVFIVGLYVLIIFQIVKKVNPKFWSVLVASLTVAAYGLTSVFDFYIATYTFPLFVKVNFLNHIGIFSFIFIFTYLIFETTVNLRKKKHPYALAFLTVLLLFYLPIPSSLNAPTEFEEVTVGIVGLGVPDNTRRSPEIMDILKSRFLEAIENEDVDIIAFPEYSAFLPGTSLDHPLFKDIQSHLIGDQLVLLGLLLYDEPSQKHLDAAVIIDAKNISFRASPVPWTDEHYKVSRGDPLIKEYSFRNLSYFPVICYEEINPYLLEEIRKLDIDFFFSLSSNEDFSWFGEAYMKRISGNLPNLIKKPYVRVANFGFHTIYDWTGKLIWKTDDREFIKYETLKIPIYN